MNDTRDDEWYWNLEKGVAVPAAERGPSEHMMGPYPSRAEAENWKSKVEARNETWDDADEEWRGERDEDDLPHDDEE
ncbi:MAG: SPOR domain-containing protein [Ilumatobacter sp.]|nr:SPOR domain-containing protein [Ilumatobacter sp.]